MYFLHYLVIYLIFEMFRKYLFSKYFNYIHPGQLHWFYFWGFLQELHLEITPGVPSGTIQGFPRLSEFLLIRDISSNSI